jgi:von Willebrand factor type A C-terminal domain/von Willebrand factor type A domain
MTRFVADVYQNEYLPVGGTEVNAIVTIACAGGGSSPQQPAAAEIVIVDTSGSMDVPRKKIRAAQDATSVAIDCIRDGVAFAVIAGTSVARKVYPHTDQLATASETTRDQAKQAIGRLRANGGTAMGSWLMLARELFDTVPDRICHAILLTDGENEHETAWQLDEVLSACTARFQCDCRGVGTDWQVSELRRIASALLGTVDIVQEPENLAEDFRRMTEAAMAKATGNVSLRIWVPQGAQLAFVRQVAPTIEELTGRGVAVNSLTADYPTGSWGEESRDYHVCIEVPPRDVGAEMLAGRVSILDGEEVVGQGLIKAIWTSDQLLSTRINREVAHYTGQAELAECVQDGLEARKAADEGTATFKLGQAVRLASESGNDGTMRLLEAVVDVIDAATGTVRLRAEVSDADEMALDTRSVRTVRVGPGA